MGQVLHRRAASTHAVRAAVQQSKGSIAELSRVLGINPKTVVKQRKRQTVEDQKTGPKNGTRPIRSFDMSHAVTTALLSIFSSDRL